MKLETLAQDLGVDYTATYVPFSQSRNYKPGVEKGVGFKSVDLSLNWKVKIVRMSSEIVIDYMQGIAHYPKYGEIRRAGGGILVVDWDAMIADLERGSYYTSSHTVNRKFPPPKFTDVMYALLLDSDAVNHANFESWARDFGYDTDSRSAEATYRACLDTGLKLNAMLGQAKMAEMRELFKDY